MPEFILPAEADHCPHCNAVLRDPPNCCETMEREYSEEMHRQNDPHYLSDADVLTEDEDYDGSGDCPFCEGDGCDECDYTGEYV